MVLTDEQLVRDIVSITHGESSLHFKLVFSSRSVRVMTSRIPHQRPLQENVLLVRSWRKVTLIIKDVCLDDLHW